ncbi:MAG: efflux transporter outer membrane subunit [Azospirillaceae bacterium]|nr:efflux transporter outer membrane subunit [Azospirillaceae bacterium]
MRYRNLAALFMLGLAAGCTVGPDYQASVPDVPDHWTEVCADGDAPVRPVDLSAWWRRFDDPLLDRLIDQAIAGNLDLKRAMQRLVEARAERDIVAATELPTIAAEASGTSARSSERLTYPPGVGGYKTYEGGLDAAWEIDVFGGTRRAVEAADAQVEVSVEDRRAILVSLLAEIAVDYATLRSDQSRLAIAERNIAAERQMLALTRRALTAGLGRELDVLRARAAVEASESRLPPLQAAIARLSHAISVLVGGFPGDQEPVLTAPGRPIPVPPELPATLPSEVVRNRPDIKQAERRLAAATAQIGVATADLFPHFKIPLAIGPMVSNVHDLFLGESLVWSVGLAANQTLYDGGRTRARIAVAQAVAEQDRLAYQQAIRIAFRDVEDQLVNRATEARRRALLEAAAADERTALDHATQLYARGLTDFLKVLDSQRAVFQSDDSLAQSDLAEVLAVIGLYKALGGGALFDAPVTQK